MATRADLVRRSLHRNLRPKKGLAAFLLRRETWHTVLWVAKTAGAALSQVADPKTAYVGRKMCRAIDYITKEQKHPLTLTTEQAPPVHQDRRGLLLQAQLLQLNLNQLSPGTPEEVRLAMKVRLETLLTLLTTNEQGANG